MSSMRQYILLPCFVLVVVFCYNVQPTYQTISNRTLLRSSGIKTTTTTTTSKSSRRSLGMDEWQMPTCPTSDELIHPCVCNSSKSEIICRGTYSTSSISTQSSSPLSSSAISTSESDSIDHILHRVFRVFSKHVPNQQYNSLSINLRNLNRLEANLFDGVRFRTILLRGNNLSYINCAAFNGTEHAIRSLYIYKTRLTNQEPKYDFFCAIRSLYNLQKLTINGNNLIDIPDKAFSYSNNENGIFIKNPSLQEIVISTGTITTIGSDAFANLTYLNNIMLNKNHIQRIKSYAFRTNYRSNITLLIDLTDNLLEPNSFEHGSLIGSQRPIRLNFGLGGCNPRLIYLPNDIFQPFFDENELNSIDIGRDCYNIDCNDCRSAWIMDPRYQYRVKNVRCIHNGVNVPYREYIKMANCSKNVVENDQTQASTNQNNSQRYYKFILD